MSSVFLDKRLAATREQYHLYMLEIELTNRFFVTEFINADKKDYANRCVRWFGEFFPNSVDLSALERLLDNYS